MSNRKPRPLSRDSESESLRDDRLFIIACDDTYAPKQYFSFFSIARIKVHVVPTPTDDNKSHAAHVLERLESYEHDEDDERWMLLDTDHYIKNQHIRSFIRAIKDAQKKGIKVALSRPCFEIYLLLHYVDESEVAELKNAGEVEAALNQVLGMKYDKTNLRLTDYPLEKVRDGYFRAKALDEKTPGGDIPKSNTTRIYLLWDAIFAKSLQSQLPPELWSLLPTRNN